MNVKYLRSCAYGLTVLGMLMALLPIPEAPANAAASQEFVHVKFAEGTSVRLRGGFPVSTSDADLSSVRGLLHANGVAISRLFRADEATLDGFSRAAVTRSGRAAPDLNQWYRLRLRPGADPVPLINALKGLTVVAEAYREPLAAPPPIAPDFRSRQGYRVGGSGNGVDADYAATVPGGTGANVRVLDIEFGWTTSHEDLSKLRASGALVPNGTPRFSYTDHGTAVMGEMSGDDNGGGVLGIVPDARMHMTNVSNYENGYDPANAVIAATAALDSGDVMLLEQQTTGPSGCSGYVALEWIPAVYDAIVTATASGIHVVEAAGNGRMNLDSSCFGSRFPRGKPDSGAIIVGAGGAGGSCSTARQRLSFSSYGSRVNVQGWGECVTTTGYGDLYGSSASTEYTARFSGTSSASPIVAGSVAALSSVAQQRGILLTPADLRARLISTGTPQVNPSSGHIGPLPNLRAAIAALPNPGGPDFSISVSPNASTVDPGQSATVTVSTATISGTPQTVALSASGLPSGATATFNPSSVTSGESASLTITTSASTPAGTYPVTITGTGTSLSHTTTHTLTVRGQSTCDGYEFEATGNLTSGGSDYHPDGSWFYTGSSGTHAACLDGPDSTDFDLYLQKWNGSSWTTVASGTSSGPDETLSYQGTAGYYRYRVHAYSGSGPYHLGHNRP